MRNEHEPRIPEELGEHATDSERLIPIIPGVEHSETDPRELGMFSPEELDEGSEEDVLEEISQELKAMLKIFGVERISNADHQEIIQLWRKMEMSQFLVADLALHTTVQKQKSLQNNMVWPHWKDLLEVAETLDNPYEVRIKLINQAAQNLMKLGFGRLRAYSLPRRPDEDAAQAFKIQGWLIGLPFMQDLIPQVNTEVKASGGLRPSRVFRLSLDEIIRQARIIDSDEVKGQYDQRITYEARAYQDLQKNIKNTYRIADFGLSKFAAR
jgi:hypothetical protein